MSDLYLGLDLGGTNIKAGVVDGRGEIVGQVEIPSGSTPDGIITNLVRAAHSAVSVAAITIDKIEAIGIVAPGQLNLKTGVVLRSANLPDWVDVPLRQRLQDALGRPTVLENDANAAAYGEYWAGAGRGSNIKELVLFTLGTGVGGGVITGGRVIQGHQSFAAELGHMIIVPDGELCGCGQRGCLEVYASASRTGHRATKLLQTTDRTSTLRKKLADNGEVTSADVANHAAAGDALALEVWNLTCKYLAIAIINAVHFMDPEMIVLAGGMVKAGPFLLDNVKEHVRQMYWRLVPLDCVIALSALGNDAGMIGAAGVARHAMEPRKT
jgi:glucokinase